MLIDIEQINDPNIIGELLRKLTFTEKGFGCYSNFELREGFEPFFFPKDHWLRKEDVNNYYGSYLDEEDGEIYCFTNGQWDVAWLWSGDGTLIFRINSDYYINTDCKKSRGWFKITK